MVLWGSAGFSPKLTSSKILSGTLPVCQMVWIQIKTDVLLVLIWVQTVCKGYQKMTKVAVSDFFFFGKKLILKKKSADGNKSIKNY